MKKAKQVFVIDQPRRRPLPILKSSKDLLKVKKCADKAETILRLAFLAAELGFNAVLKVKVSYEKIRNAGYQKMEWSGEGFAAELDPARMKYHEE